MAVDLRDLVDPLKRAINGPGADLYPATTINQWVGFLADAFWSVRIEAGLFSDFAINEDDEIVPLSGDEDMARDYQSIIVLWAALGIISNAIRTQNTRFRAKAGPAEFETENSATALNAALAELQARRAMILERLSDLGNSGTDEIFDLIESVGFSEDTYTLR